MLDPWIIEEILKRENERRREEDSGRVDLPLHTPIYQESDPQPGNQDEDSKRGVVVIDI